MKIIILRKNKFYVEENCKEYIVERDKNNKMIVHELNKTNEISLKIWIFIIFIVGMLFWLFWNIIFESVMTVTNIIFQFFGFNGFNNVEQFMFTILGCFILWLGYKLYKKRRLLKKENV